jgi:hypothetical protein
VWLREANAVILDDPVFAADPFAPSALEASRVGLNTLSSWWQERGHRTPRIVEDVRALISMAAAMTLAVLVWNQVLFLLPTESVDALFSPTARLGHFGIEHVLAAVVGFYFGSRS